MTVLSFYNPGDPVVAVDLFVDYPVAYDLLLKRSEMKDLGGVQARVCSLDDLIAMKRRVGRPRDLEDVRILETIRSEQKKHS
jgi:predicted nucleotidyltransferase